MNSFINNMLAKTLPQGSGDNVQVVDVNVDTPNAQAVVVEEKMPADFQAVDGARDVPADQVTTDNQTVDTPAADGSMPMPINDQGTPADTLAATFAGNYYNTLANLSNLQATLASAYQNQAVEVVTATQEAIAKNQVAMAQAAVGYQQA